MALVAHLRDKNSLYAYHQQVDTSKAKELCCGGRRTSDSPHPLFEPLRLNGQAVEQFTADIASLSNSSACLWRRIAIHPKQPQIGTQFPLDQCA
ncbi:hypothetical protein SKAU_G00275130 [Synaphobranchus kaupii]|uniref:Uncharacterized protein n=1 Tax=Synaphobranchus kaupii TaxID=118154 RepID=A0A9Q1F0Y6_SYNKA|nr:hypothetical protein SKAU_G00275130 [Synaphobranchus kaupii]